MSGKRVSRGRKQHKRTAKNWGCVRDLVFVRAGGTCEFSGEDLFTVKHGEDCDGNNCDNFDDGYCKKRWHWAAHHIIAERFVRRLFPGVNPHQLFNLAGITASLHSKITAAENKLFKADWLGYRSELHRLGVSLSILDAAWGALCAEEKRLNATKS